MAMQDLGHHFIIPFQKLQFNTGMFLFRFLFCTKKSGVGGGESRAWCIQAQGPRIAPFLRRTYQKRKS